MIAPVEAEYVLALLGFLDLALLVVFLCDYYAPVPGLSLECCVDL